MGALPLVNQLLDQVRLEEFLRQCLPRDGRCGRSHVAWPALAAAECVVVARTALPRTRREDSDFRQRLVADPDALEWGYLYDLLDDDETLVDRLRVCAEPAMSSDGFRLLWFHSTRKAQRDAMSRTRMIERTCQELTDLQTRLQAPRTRFRERAIVETAVAESFQRSDVARWVTVTIPEVPQEEFKQATRGRPGEARTRNTSTKSVCAIA